MQQPGSGFAAIHRPYVESGQNLKHFVRQLKGYWNLCFRKIGTHNDEPRGSRKYVI